MSMKPPPAPDAITAAYWQRLRDGHLSFQRCADCSTAWLPPAPVCPRCWGTEAEVVDSSGRARLVTWATYRRSYHPAFADSLPYVVGMVELAEGPRLTAGIRTGEPARLHAGDPLTLALEPREGGFLVPVFVRDSAPRTGIACGGGEDVD